MVENLISGLYLLGEVGLLGLLVYKSHKSANRIRQVSSDKSTKSEPIKNSAFRDLV
jgi:hypothetical protein